MRRQAKAKGAGPKGTEGVMNVSGKTINFKVEDDDFPGTLPKTTKKWLTSMGIQMKVLITLPGGVTLDDGEEDEQTSADTLGGAEDNPPDLPPDASDDESVDVLAERRALITTKIKDLGGRTAAIKDLSLIHI